MFARAGEGGDRIPRGGHGSERLGTLLVPAKKGRGALPLSCCVGGPTSRPLVVGREYVKNGRRRLFLFSSPPSLLSPSFLFPRPRAR
eukprot:scaffold99025_cov15-Tisochrysis_lutea.AAC.1